jgi:hypothetical protein
MLFQDVYGGRMFLFVISRGLPGYARESQPRASVLIWQIFQRPCSLDPGCSALDFGYSTCVPYSIETMIHRRVLHYMASAGI